MLELNMNGRRMSDQDITVLVSKDSIQNLTEVKFFTDEGEVALDDITAAIVMICFTKSESIHGRQKMRSSNLYYFPISVKCS